MTFDEFRRLAETWGGDVERWPAATRNAARPFAATLEGGRILAEQARLDRLFAAAPEIEAGRAERSSFLVLQRLANVQQRRPQWHRFLFPRGLVPAASLACSVLVGVWLAGAIPYVHPPSDPLSVMSGVFDVYAIGFGSVQ
ncbi:hypothetical protein [Bradyrhizobium sp. MOS003]|jgi:hypothetical protein|uniref:hypothetical protein n=1 Tax=Bradyrhizobium sp. MOS003 TaxID=2133946 RepID=UPI000D13077B|nr:hypothetical protein [Bradyrhizobium sp. MOS003]PSO20544.1 hypothetical protein C7G42_02155 [Bradyrhizobium sp. MOS003]